MVALVFSAGLEGKSVAASTGLGDTEAANSVGGKAGKVLFLLLLVTPFTDHGVCQSVLKRSGLSLYRF